MHCLSMHSHPRGLGDLLSELSGLASKYNITIMHFIGYQATIALLSKYIA